MADSTHSMVVIVRRVTREYRSVDNGRALRAGAFGASGMSSISGVLEVVVHIFADVAELFGRCTCKLEPRRGNCRFECGRSPRIVVELPIVRIHAR